MQIDLFCPVENQGVTVKTNSTTKEPYALFKLFNLSDRVVTSVSFVVHAFDANGGELGQLSVTLDDLSAEPKQFFAETKAVSLTDFPDAKHLLVDFQEVHFEEGDSYIKTGEETEVTINELNYDARVRLMSVAGEDAQCYYQEEDSHWVCVCGRPNILVAEECIRCGREQEVMKECFSSDEALEEVIERKEEEQRAFEEEQKALEAEKKEKRNKNIKKGLTIGGISIAALAILCALAYFIYNFVMVQLGNSAAKSGDYVKAYSYYAAVDNGEKIAEVSGKVQGNSSANLLQTGILASDEENIYYIDLAYTIYKQSKTTGEKARLGETVGVYLNVLDGWVYYLDVSTGQTICRIRTDGTDKEVLYEGTDTFFAGLTVVGNEMYFIAQQPMSDLTPEMQEQMLMQGQSPYEYRLYRLKVGDDKPKMVLDTDLVQFTIYKDKLYYIDQADGAVYYINRTGGEPKKIINGPVYSFDIYNDSIYYLDSTPIPETGMPKLSMERTDMDGNYQETVISDQTVLALAVENGDVYYLAYVDGVGVIHKLSGGVDTVISENSQMFNLKDGYIAHINGEQKLMKSTYDMTGFEEVLPSEEVTELTDSENAE